MGERSYEAERPAESPGYILRRCWELFAAERNSELHRYLWQHDRIRQIIANHARGGIEAPRLIQLIGGSPYEQEELRALLAGGPEILQSLPFLVRFCLMEPLTQRKGDQVTIPEQFQERMDEALLLDQDKTRNPYASMRLVEICDGILNQLQPGKQLRFRARVLTMQAAAYRRSPTGDPVDRIRSAIKCCEEALALSSPQTDGSLYAHILAQLGTCYGRLEGGDAVANGQLGIKYLEQALELMPLDEAQRDRGVLMNNLANAYMHLPMSDGRADRLLQALKLYEAALSCFPAHVAPLDYARTQTCRAIAYYELDSEQDLNRALDCCKEALRYQTQANAPFDFAATMRSMANIYRHLPEQVAGENYAEAIRCYEAALKVFTPTHFADECVRLNEDLGDLHAENRNWIAAYAAYRAAIFAGEQLYRGIRGDASELAAIARFANLYRLAAFAAARCGGITEALLTLEHGKTRMLSTVLAADQNVVEGIDEQDWLDFDRAVDTALSASQAGRSSPRSEFYSQFSGMLSDLQQLLPNFDLLTGMAPEAAINLGEVYDAAVLKRVEIAARSLVPDERTALISFCLCAHGSLAFVVYHDPQKQIECVEAPNYTLRDVRKLLLTPEIDGGWLIDYTNFKARPQSAAAQEACLATLTHVLDQVGRGLMMPIIKSLPSQITKLILLPAAELFLLPLHAVPLSDESDARLCDRYEISYAPSARVLAKCYARAAQAKGESLYMVTNPTEDRALTLSDTVGDLIVRFFPQALARHGRTATKQAVRTEAPRYGYLHFFCHGNYSWYDPSESYLRLAPASPEQSEYDTLAFDDLRMGLLQYKQARLVVLGACEAGLADMGNQTPDEYVGLASGFLQAGVPCVISALWMVEVVSTILLLERFYANHRLGKMSFTAALQEAQRWLRQQTAITIKEQIERLYRESGSILADSVLRRQNLYYWRLAQDDPGHRPFAHPYYWAGFTINGV